MTGEQFRAVFRSLPESKKAAIIALMESLKTRKVEAGHEI